MSNSNEYNGWTNFETWQAALWLGEADYRSSDSEEIEEFIREVYLSEVSATGLVGDIINGWLSCVNFHEIADSYA